MRKQTTITAPEGHYIDLENSKIVYKPIERELPKTWGDYCILTMTPSYKNPSMYDKLIELRDYYNEECKFNWYNNSPKYCISSNFKDDFKLLHLVTIVNYKNSPFYFKSKELAEEFMTNFDDMLKEYFINL
jgi:hypothetical protein